MTGAAFEDEFAAFKQARTRSDPAWLRKLREESLGLFVDQGLPTTRQESWRYTSLAALQKVGFCNSRVPDAAALAEPVLSETLERNAVAGISERHVFVDGHYARNLSTAKHSVVESLASLRCDTASGLAGLLGRFASPKHHAFAALNTAFLDDGAVIRVPEGAHLEEPVYIVFVSSPMAARSHHPRVLIQMGAGSQATLIQDHLSAGSEPTLCNTVTEVEAQPDSSLDLIIVQRESDAAFHVSNTTLHLDRDARVGTHTVTLGGALVRNDLAVHLGAEGSECSMNGLFFAAGKRLVDNHTQVEHAAPHGTSHELYKGILAGHSRGVFRGRVIVRPDAQKTDAQQQNPNLILGSGAEIDSRPQLEINADDVKCSHGTSIGRLNEDALFYLRSRGIERDRAFALLTEGFANEVLEAIPNAAVVASLKADLHARLFESGGDS